MTYRAYCGEKVLKNKHFLDELKSFTFLQGQSICKNFYENMKDFLRKFAAH